MTCHLLVYVAQTDGPPRPGAPLVPRGAGCQARAASLGDLRRRWPEAARYVDQSGGQHKGPMVSISTDGPGTRHGKPKTLHKPLSFCAF